jgi:cold shock CspA family protein
MADRKSGTIKSYNPDRGYGFIRYDGDKSIFVHITDVTGAKILYEGDAVEFEIGPGRDERDKACNVTVQR